MARYATLAFVVLDVFGQILGRTVGVAAEIEVRLAIFAIDVFPPSFRSAAKRAIARHMTSFLPLGRADGVAAEIKVRLAIFAI